MEYGWPHRRTALVVDDDIFVLTALADMLSEEGYDVHTASNGFSAMKYRPLFSVCPPIPAPIVVE